LFAAWRRTPRGISSSPGRASQDFSGYGIYARRYVADLSPVAVACPTLRSRPAGHHRHLAAGFIDIEDGANGLTYTLSSNSNPALFSSRRSPVRP